MKIIIQGLPGSGKSTQGQILAEQYQIPHISIGEKVKQYLEQDIDISHKLKDYFTSSPKWQPLSDELIKEVVELSLKDLINPDNWVIDGYPRNIKQAEEMEIKPDLIISLDTNEEEIIKRMISRQRQDDNPEIIAQRLETEKERSEPLENYLQQNFKFRKIDGNADITDIKNEVETIIKKEYQLPLKQEYKFK